MNRGYTGTEVHALSFVGSSGKINGVKVHNIVSARGDAFAIQFFPSNEISVGGDISISSIHAGAYLEKKVLLSLEDPMPNKIPRACAITIWTWTDDEEEFYQNKINFLDKDSMDARCVTTHTFCSNSPYDHEAILRLIARTARPGNANVPNGTSKDPERIEQVSLVISRSPLREIINMQFSRWAQDVSVVADT